MLVAGAETFTETGREEPRAATPAGSPVHLRATAARNPAPAGGLAHQAAASTPGHCVRRALPKVGALWRNRPSLAPTIGRPNASRRERRSCALACGYA